MRKLISAIVLVVSTTLAGVVATSAPAHAAFDACASPDTSTKTVYSLKSSTSTLSFGSVTVYRNSVYRNWLCVKFSTGGKVVQRYDSYTRLNLTATGSCPVPGGAGGDFEPPYGTGYNKSYYIEPGTCVRALYSIKYSGDWYYATFMRKRL